MLIDLPALNTRMDGKPVIWCSLQSSTSAVQSTCMRHRSHKPSLKAKPVSQQHEMPHQACCILLHLLWKGSLSLRCSCQGSAKGCREAHLGISYPAVAVWVLVMYRASDQLPGGLQPLAPGAPGRVEVHHNCRQPHVRAYAWFYGHDSPAGVHHAVRNISILCKAGRQP